MQIMNSINELPIEIELELKKFKFKISKMNKEEMFHELLVLKFDSESNLFFINKYLNKHGINLSRQIIRKRNTDHALVAFGYLSEQIHSLFKKHIFPITKIELNKTS